ECRVEGATRSVERSRRTAEENGVSVRSHRVEEWSRIGRSDVALVLRRLQESNGALTEIGADGLPVESIRVGGPRRGKHSPSARSCTVEQPICGQVLREGLQERERIHLSARGQVVVDE